MKIRLIRAGGIYGTVELKEIDTDAPGINVPGDVLNVFKAAGMKKFEVSDSRQSKEQAGAKRLPRTELENFYLRVTHSQGAVREYRISETDLDEVDQLRTLIKCITRLARPVG